MAEPRRIIVKLGTSVLTGGTRRLDRRRILEIVRQAVQVHDEGAWIALVSSGAIAAGREALNNPAFDRSVPARQMLAAVGQGRLIQLYSEMFGLFDIRVAQVLLTRGDLTHRTGYLNARDTLLTLLAHRIVPIINENDTVATEEIKVGDNDNLSALVANLIDADLLVLLTDQLGLYSADPRTDPTAELIHRVEVIDEGIWARAGGTSTGLGTGGMITKLQAAQLAGHSGAATVIASGDLPNAIPRVVAGESLGTYFAPQTTHLESRKRWLLSEKAHGALKVDQGAADRLANGGASLLPVGVTALTGKFERGAVVRVHAPDGKPIAVGMTNYGSAEVRQLLGVRSSRIASVLGYTFGDEVIHRDNLVVL
ncbi:MAG: glutamate 5-kinase [Anaerolineae bacterium]|nr:glutamate 5-kinase [Anaerolineae bacterium]